MSVDKKMFNRVHIGTGTNECFKADYDEIAAREGCKVNASTMFINSQKEVGDDKFNVYEYFIYYTEWLELTPDLAKTQAELEKTEAEIAKPKPKLVF